MDNRDTLLLSVLSAGRYFVTDSGVLFDRRAGCPREGTPDTEGHPVVNLAECGAVRVSRLAALQFFGLPPTKAGHVRHMNGDVTDNAKTNLQWSTAKQTSKRAHDEGRIPHPKGTDLPSTKLDQEKVAEARRLLAAGVSMREVARRLGVTTGAIEGIKYGKSWRHV